MVIITEVNKHKTECVQFVWTESTPAHLKLLLWDVGQTKRSTLTSYLEVEIQTAFFVARTWLLRLTASLLKDTG